MRLEFESNASALSLAENETVSESSVSEGEQLLRSGVKAAQEGRRSEAKALLLRVTELEPQNENAWLWLASISEYPEELLVFLNNVLRVNPENERAIEWKKATKSLLAKTLVQRGVDASKEQRNQFARQCFEQAVEHDPESEVAWLWLASVVESEVEKTEMFEKVLAINPDNETAAAAIGSFRKSRTADLLETAVCEAVEGNHPAAQQILAIVLEEDDSLEHAWVLKAHLANSFEERAECLLKLRSLNTENEMARVCLASWRELVEKTAPARSIPVVPSVSDTMDFEATPSESVETDNEQIFAETDDEAAEVPVMVSSHPVAESMEYAAPEMPTQEFVSLADFADLQESSEVKSESSSEFEASAVSFEGEADLAQEIAEEESEMSAAFDDLHRTVTPDRDTDVEFALKSEPSFEPFETIEETESPDQGEWRNTSPDVFVGYVPVESEKDGPMISEHVAEQPGHYAEFLVSDAPEGESCSPIEEQKAESFEASEPQESWASSAPANFSEPSFDPSSEEFSEPLAAEVPMAETNYFDPGFHQVAESMPVAADNGTEVSPVAEPEPQAVVDAPKADLAFCPFCNTENERQSYSCAACHAILGLTDLETVFNHNSINKEIIQKAVDSFEREHESYGLNPDQLANLGLGHINLKNYRQGYLFLQEAVHANPSNVVLDAQLNAFAIRLEEFERLQTVHDAMSKNRKILVVDDSPTVRKLISSKLEKSGHEVVCAVDGLDALEKLNGLRPDLILLDITMPRMDGYQVCKLIRNNTDMKDVPVVMISGKDGFFDKVRGRMAGTTDYITKPFGPETLMKTVENYLS